MKTTSLRFKEFDIDLKGHFVIFSRHSQKSNELEVRHETDLRKVHIKLGFDAIGDVASSLFYTIEI